MSTGIISFANKDRALFYDYVDESKKKYKEWMKDGEGYTRIKAQITCQSTGSVVATDIKQDSSCYIDTLNVINAKCPSFTVTTPNMDGSMHSAGTSYGLLFMSVLDGGHTGTLLQLMAQFVPVTCNLFALQGNQFTTFLLDKETDEFFYNSFIIGCDRDNDINVLAIRFSSCSYQHCAKTSSGDKMGVGAAFQGDYVSGIVTQARSNA